MIRIRLAAFVFAAAALPFSLEAQQAALPGTGAVLRVLDKTSGQSANYDLTNGQSFELGTLRVSLRECRYPEDNPTGDAFAFIDVRETKAARDVFSGWMIASSPALNAMEHARYDVWVLRCSTS